MKIFKLNKEDPVQVGSVVRYKDSNNNKKVGEVCSILGDGASEKYELIMYDKRLKPIMSADSKFKRKTVKSDRCKLIDENFKFNITDNFELGDVICKSSGLIKRYGIIVGFIHPDGLYTTSYEHGYNGVDLLECVEIHKRGLQRKRDVLGKVKRFTTSKSNIKCCEVDLWNRTGPKIVTK
jgi:hypothetical protein